MAMSDNQSAIRNPQSAIVFKLGGSLLDLPDLPRTLDGILAQRPNHAPLVVIGGGASADVVREWDRMHHLGDTVSHELALEAMALNESFVQHLIPNTRLVRNEKQFHAAIAEQALPILCAACFLPWAESQGHVPLLRSWDVTSDSIAAWVARVLHAEELVLLKSADLPAGVTLSAASNQGLVDPYFATAAAEVPCISWCNARKANAVITPWLPL